MDDLTFIFIIFISFIVLTIAALRFAWVRRPKSDLPKPVRFNENFYSEKWYRKLNAGAFLYAPVWLFSNRFWVCAAICILIPPASALFGIFLLFKGNELSWGGGERWGNDVESFLDEQFFWSMLGICGVGALFILLLLELF